MARRLLTPLLCVLAVACLPRVGPTLDGGDPGPGAPLDAGCLGPAECASGVCLGGRCALAFRDCSLTYSGCGASVDWVEVIPDGGVAAVSFPSSEANRYSPQCLRVHLGQQVSFQGSFGSHPLDQACGPVFDLIPPTAGGADPVVVRFDTALGLFGYYCENHGGADGHGMAGAIEVVK
jgi:plastocyanin